MSNLFPNKCGIYAAATDFRFVSDCQVLPAPLPIWDAPELEIDPDTPPPPVVEIPIACPTPKIAGMNSVDYQICVDPKLTAAVHPAGNNCAFVFDVNLLLPDFECTVFSLQSVATHVVPKDCGGVICDINTTVANTDACGDVCKFLFDMDTTLELPTTICTFIDLNLACITNMGNRCGQPSGELLLSMQPQDSCATDCNMTADAIILATLPKPACANLGIYFNLTVEEAHIEETVVVVEKTLAAPCDGPDCAYTADIHVLLPAMDYSAPDHRVGLRGPTGPPGEQGVPGQPGLDGTNGADGASGRNGTNGLPGANGDNCSFSGDMGAPGKDGPTGPDGYMHPDAKMGATGNTGPAGIGVQGPKGEAGAPCPEEMGKDIILPVLRNGRRTNVALFCAETPEVRFEDLLTVYCEHGEGRQLIDDRFMQVCEPQSIQVVSLLPNRAVCVGARVGEATVVVRCADNLPAYVTVLLSGHRRGCPQRFPAFTKAQMDANTRFWAQARTG